MDCGQWSALNPRYEAVESMLTDDVKLETLIIRDVLIDEVHLDSVDSTSGATTKYPQRYPVQQLETA